MQKIILELTDEQFARCQKAIGKHMNFKTAGIAAKGENAADRVADTSELEAFLIEHLRQMVVMVEKQEAVVETF